MCITFLSRSWWVWWRLVAWLAFVALMAVDERGSEAIEINEAPRCLDTCLIPLFTKGR